MSAFKLIDLIVRLGNAIIKAINKRKIKEASDNPADTIANGGRVQHSKQSFADLAAKSQSDKAE
jgi:hypothetical protein